MSTKRIVYTLPNGKVAVVTPATEFVARFSTEDEALTAVQTKSVPLDATNIVVIDVASLPLTRRFRGVWRQSGAGPPVVDMPLARLQRMDEVRAERASKLVKSDGDYLRAQEAGKITLQTTLKD